MKKYFLLLMSLAAGRSLVQAQVDPHFSQYYVFPSWLNPALTGAFDGDFKVSGIYRSQWGQLNNGFRTFGVNAEAVTSKKLNIGLNLFQQSTGSGYTYQNGYASFAYTGVRFGKEDSKVIAVGIQAGMLARRFDPSKFTTGEQWSQAGGFNGGAATGEVLAQKGAMVFDAGAGALYYDMDASKKASPYLGVSANHLTQPEGVYINSTDKMPMRLTVHGGVAINVSESFVLTPNFLYLQQGNTDEKMIGAFAQYRASSELSLLGGINYRFQDAAVPFAGFDYKNFMLGVSYDVNNSDLGRTVSNVNSFEVSLSYVFRRNRLLGQRHFSCPRL
ncbi:type IX secretion system membrane protein PorP/SprF [Flaviaesturariibacter flavus]|uniref:Type IX secretion system membrane protein PorP/SprF n=1 Tax=Flaviaesturariibacter flavus TaxID=2502780 RepID=A0A4R1BB45_9BACT|nr:PorP/SprF family type IX secretion system membrane protein [Flaviaesturariibacter flavus]TCJ14216.1 type IX secretion system membrane protein PorP/SprF [Flaviaesturariibacter flavus]